jgi:hypothetical protein
MIGVAKIVEFLVSLDINNCYKINDFGLKKVIERHGKTLQYLNIQGIYPITNESFQAIANNCKVLNYLVCGNHYSGNIDLKSLSV